MSVLKVSFRFKTLIFKELCRRRTRVLLGTTTQKMRICSFGFCLKMCIFKEVAPTAYKGTPRRADTEDAHLQVKRKGRHNVTTFLLCLIVYIRVAQYAHFG